MCYNVVKRNTFEVKIMTTTVSLRLPKDLKKQATDVFNEYGLDLVISNENDFNASSKRKRYTS